MKTGFNENTLLFAGDVHAGSLARLAGQIKDHYKEFYVPKFWVPEFPGSLAFGGQCGLGSRDQRYAPSPTHNQTSQFKSSSLTFTVIGFNFKASIKNIICIVWTWDKDTTSERLLCLSQTALRAPKNEHPTVFSVSHPLYLPSSHKELRTKLRLSPHWGEENKNLARPVGATQPLLLPLFVKFNVWRPAAFPLSGHRITEKPDIIKTTSAVCNPETILLLKMSNNQMK